MALLQPTLIYWKLPHSTVAREAKLSASASSFAADVRPEYRSSLPAITHIDGTARLQAVDEENTPFLYALLKAFEAKTGYPILLNTSLNGPGQPLVESPQDAVEFRPVTF